MELYLLERDRQIENMRIQNTEMQVMGKNELMRYDQNLTKYHHDRAALYEVTNEYKIKHDLETQNYELVISELRKTICDLKSKLGLQERN